MNRDVGRKLIWVFFGVLVGAGLVALGYRLGRLTTKAAESVTLTATPCRPPAEAGATVVDQGIEMVWDAQTCQYLVRLAATPFQPATPTPVVVEPTPIPTTMATPAAIQAAAGAGALASDQPTNMDGYQVTPIGALTSDLPLLCETWGPGPDGAARGFVVTVPAGSIMWEQGHFGGTCWWVDPTDLDAAVRRSVVAITNRDGVSPVVVRLPTDHFPLLGCLQSKPVKDGIRWCQPVGGFPGYDAPAELPEPGYFPGYGKR